MKKQFLLSVFLMGFTLFFIPNETNAQCDEASAQINLDANFVSARLLSGGGLWWDTNAGQYIVPAGGQTAALFCGSLWMGGLDSGGTLHMAGQTYGAGSGALDYWPGPLNEDGTTDATTCLNWDKFFVVTRDDIEAHRADWAEDSDIDGPIPSSVRGWPGLGNPLFFEEHGFDLPSTSAGLAPFFDRNQDGIYNPEEGDYPLAKGDQSIWSVFNDEGGGAVHGETAGAPIRMEIQTNAFSFEDSEEPAAELTTFYDYRLIYRGEEPLTNFYLSLWVDPDLGCWADDFIGCIPDEDLGYVYNADNNDENCSGLIGYGTDIPLLGIKILNSYTPGNAEPTGLSKFMFYNNPTAGAPPQTNDPSFADDYYGYMRGVWLDGTKLTQGGSGYDSEGTGTPTDFAFDGNPADENGWSECTVNSTPGDRRFLMSFGPYDLQPGDIGEFSFAVVWLPSQPHPCPDVTDLIDAANDMATLYSEHSEEIMTSSYELAEDGTVQVSPNPVHSEAILQVTISGVELQSVQLYSASGNLMERVVGISGSQAILKMDDFPNGLYLYRAMLSDGRVATGKVVRK